MKTQITTHSKKAIVEKLALEIPQTQIAKQHNLSQSRVSLINTENKEIIESRKKELQALTPSILEEFKHDCMISKELSLHLHRPKENKNETALKDNADIISYKKSLASTKIKILENTGILEANTIRFGDDHSQHLTISPSYQAFLDYQSNQEEIKEIKEDDT